MPQNNLLGSIIPNVYIKRVSLETEGSALKERNPHIDHEREPEIVRNPETGKLEVDKLSPELLKKGEEKPLTINIDLLIKESLDNGIIASWFGNQDFMKYVKIKIVQSKSQEATNLFATKQISLIKQLPAEHIKLMSEIERQDVLITQDSIKNKVGTREQFGDSVLEQYSSYVDEDGNKIYDISYRSTFRVPNSNPKHLAYFAVAFLDVEALAQDYDMELGNNPLKVLEGRIASEMVIDDHQISSESFVFVDEKEQPWVGEVFQKEDGRWYGGNEKDENAPVLELRTISNNKIQDFRDIEEIERLQLDFSVIENEIFSSKNKIIALQKKVADDKNTFFTDFSLTRDSNGDARFLFGIDYLKLIKNNTKYGVLYREDNEELLENVRIRSIIIKRIRVKNDLNAIKGENGIARFSEDETELPETIAIAGESEPGNFVVNNTSKGSLTEIDLEMDNGANIRYFTGVDKLMSEVTFGIYQYSVEIDVEDKTSSFLTKQLNELSEAHTILGEYFSRGSSTTNFDVQSNRFKNKFIEEIEKEYEGREEESPWILPISVYLETLSILFYGFDEKKTEMNLFSYVHPRTGNPNGVNTVLNLMDSLITKTFSVLGLSTNKTPTKYQPGRGAAFNSSVRNKQKAPIKSFRIEKFFVDKFDSDVQKHVGFDFLSDGKVAAEINDNGLVVVSKVSYEKRTEMETLKYFKSIDEDINLATKVQNYTVDDLIENNRFMYLTPAKIDLGASYGFNAVGSGAQTFSRDAASRLMSSIARYNSLKNSPQLPFLLKNIYKSAAKTKTSEMEKTSAANAISMVESRGVTLRPVTAMATVVKAEQIEESGSLKVEDMMGEGSNFVNEDFTKDEIGGKSTSDISGEQEKVNMTKPILEISNDILENGITSPAMKPKAEKERAKAAGTIAVYNLNNSDNVLDRYYKGFFGNLSEEKLQSYKQSEETEKKTKNVATAPAVAQSFAKALPNQIKSVLLDSVSSNKTTKNWFTDVQEGAATATQIFQQVEDTPKAATAATATQIFQQVDDPLKDPKNKKVFQLNYHLINQVEVLSGFEVTAEGATTVTQTASGAVTATQIFRRQIKLPIWKKLTPELFNASEGKNLLCRMKKYENSDLGIKTPKTFSLPVYNEYFLISPEEKIQEKKVDKTVKKFQNILPKLVVRNEINKKFLRDEFASSLLITRNPIIKKTFTVSNVVGASLKTKVNILKDDLKEINIQKKFEITRPNRIFNNVKRNTFVSLREKLSLMNK